MAGTHVVKKILLCFLLLCLVAPRSEASHALAKHRKRWHASNEVLHEVKHEGGEGKHEKKGEEGEGGEEEGEEEDEANELSAYSMGLTMLGMLVLLTGLYHLTSAKRMETREISWKMLSGTISIFVGVVIYTSLNSVFTLWVVEPLTKYLGIKKEDRDTKDDWLFPYLNRSWVAFFYFMFVCFISYKARIGVRGGVKVRMEMLDEAPHTEDVKYAVKNNNDRHPFMSLVRKMGSLEATHHHIKSGRAQFKSALCSMKCSLFWAHAIGFAGIDGWNFSQQNICRHSGYWWCILKSMLLFLRAVVQYYIFLRLLGIAWRFLMKKVFEPKCWFIMKHHPQQALIDQVLKEKKSPNEPEEWMDYHKKEGEDEEEEEETEQKEEEKPQEFERIWCPDTSTYKYKYMFEEEGLPDAYFTRVIDGNRTDEFDPRWSKKLPIWLQYQCFVGPDYFAVPEYDELIEEWDEIRKDGENDCYALMLSFLVVQTLRLGISGELPNKAEDEHLFPDEEGNGGHHPLEALALYLFAIFFLVLAEQSYALLVRVRENPLFFEKDKKGCCGCLEAAGHRILEIIHRMESQIMRDELHGSIERILDVLVTVLCMSASWGMMYGTQWLLALCVTITKRDDAVNDVALAICVTFTMFALLYAADVFFALDCAKKLACITGASTGKAADAEEDSSQKFRKMSTKLIEKKQEKKKFERSHKGALAKVNSSVGLLIGFAWEANFDKAVENISESLAWGEGKEKESLEVLINFFCMALFVLLLLPVWKHQILPMSEEQGYKFGFVPRNLRVRLMAIEQELQAEGEDAAEKKRNHDKHMKDCFSHLQAVETHLSKWNKEHREKFPPEVEGPLGRHQSVG